MRNLAVRAGTVSSLEQKEPRQPIDPILRWTLPPAVKGPAQMDKAACSTLLVCNPVSHYSSLLFPPCFSTLQKDTTPHHHQVRGTAARTLHEIWLPFHEEKISPLAFRAAKRQEARLQGEEKPPTAAESKTVAARLRQSRKETEKYFSVFYTFYIRQR